jgi:hypothetical protein
MNVTSAGPVNNGQALNNGKANGKDKTKPQASAAAPAPTTSSSGGLGMKAVWDSQAARRAEEKEAAAAAKAKARTLPPQSQLAPDGLGSALRLMQESVKDAEANRVASEKAAEKREAEAKRREARLAEQAPASNRFRTDAAQTVQEATKPSIAFQSYQSTYKPAEEPGSSYDGRF